MLISTCGMSGTVVSIVDGFPRLSKSYGFQKTEGADGLLWDTLVCDGVAVLGWKQNIETNLTVR